MSGKYRRRWPGIVLDGMCAFPLACVIYSLFFAAAIKWNKLPKKLRENITLSQFKSHIKTYLFMTAFH